MMCAITLSFYLKGAQIIDPTGVRHTAAGCPSRHKDGTGLPYPSDVDAQGMRHSMTQGSGPTSLAVFVIRGYTLRQSGARTVIPRIHRHTDIQHCFCQARQLLGGFALGRHAQKTRLIEASHRNNSKPGM